MAAEAIARDKSRQGSGTSNPVSDGLADQFAQHYAQGGAGQTGGGLSQVPASSGLQAADQNPAPATGETPATAQPAPGSSERAENLLFANNGPPVVSNSGSAASKGSNGAPPLTAEEEFAAMMSGSPSTEQPSAASRQFQMPSESGSESAPAAPSELTNEVPGSPMLDLSRVDKDLLSRLPSTKRSSKAYATPVGVTVFLDQHHMTVGQQPAIPVTPDSLSSALSDLLKNIDTEVSDAKKTPREEVMPIVKFIVSPGGERWRIPLSGSLKHLGIPSASIYELSPHIETTAAPGRASW
jgi:hypothetical protein